MPAIRLADRLLAELIRRREEQAGHPQDCPAADDAAVRAGGDLAQRIAVRARALPEGASMHEAIRRLLRSAAWFATLLIVLAALAGIAAASAALGASEPASLPLVLLVVVGANLLTLLLWLIAQALSRHIAPGIGSLLRLLAQRHARHLADGNASDTTAIMQVLAGSGLGRWFAAALVHAAWLGYAIGAVLAMALLLSVRAYTLSWETTLLDDAALAAWARTLSAGPALLGVAGADALPVADAGSARQAWSLWLIAAAFVYGVMPRACAFALSLLMLWRAQRPLGRDLHRPGFARLRARLLPDHAVLGTVDPAPPLTSQATAADAPAVALSGRAHGLALEAPDLSRPPKRDGVDWIWLGNVDDAAARETALQRLRADKVDTLAVCVRAALTPDRGIERYVGELAVAARAPTALLLCDFARLRGRGSDVAAQRLADWRALAGRSGVAVVIEDGVGT